MINRVSHPLTYENFKTSSAEQESKITKLLENLYKGGKRIVKLRNDPTGVTHAIRLDNDIFKLNVYIKILTLLKATLDIRKDIYSLLQIF